MVSPTEPVYRRYCLLLFSPLNLRGAFSFGQRPLCGEALTQHPLPTRRGVFSWEQAGWGLIVSHRHSPDMGGR
jgi:hypothetical protein